VDRVLATLIHLGYLRAEEREVLPAPRLMELGEAYLVCAGLREVLTPHAERLVAELDESVSLAVPDGAYRWRVSEEELHRVVADTLREEPPYGVGRERVLARLTSLLRVRAEARGQTTDTAWTRRTGRAVREFLDTVWPVARPREVVAELLSDPAVLAEAAEGVLTPAEQSAILWSPPPRSFKSARWSEADAVLLDEVAGLIERPRGYGHVIVDEAQDLSPMQCRAVARRSEHGSITVLGDLAQGTTPWAARSWSEQLA
ncbi:AAA family ATPase, partial [Streptosporangium algeriense]